MRFTTQDTRQMRLERLNLAIERHPQAPINYLLRGELFSEQNYNHLAAQDFQKALELAQEQYQHSQWGIAEQAIIDRAIIGLQNSQTRLQAEPVQTEE